MTGIDETTAGVKIAARRRVARTRSPLELWAWEPVIILRIALVAAYLINVYFAVIAFIAGVPVFELTTPEGYTSPWAAILGLASLAAAIGALDNRWEPFERWAALVVTSMVITYVAALTIVGFISGDPNRQAVSAATTQMLVLPLTRFVWLAAQAGKKTKQ